VAGVVRPSDLLGYELEGQQYCVKRPHVRARHLVTVSELIIERLLKLTSSGELFLVVRVMLRRR